jgi:hypothetical protein
MHSERLFYPGAFLEQAAEAYEDDPLGRSYAGKDKHRLGHAREYDWRLIYEHHITTHMNCVAAVASAQWTVVMAGILEPSSVPMIPTPGWASSVSPRTLAGRG